MLATPLNLRLWVRVDRLCRLRSPAAGRHGLGMIARERVRPHRQPIGATV
jgi:hypothetical protein